MTKTLPDLALLVVVHADHPAQAVEQTQLALNNGADGVFLINHAAPSSLLTNSVLRYREEHGPDAWIGVNPLGDQTIAASIFAAKLGSAVDGLWTDNAGIDESRLPTDQPIAAEAAQARAGWDGLYFGGVAFKHQRRVANLELAAAAAAPWMDYICTSGPATGEPIEDGKLARMAIGSVMDEVSKPLAVASGVSIDNVDRLRPEVGAVLVATSVQNTFTTLNGPKIAELAAAVAELRAIREG